MGDQSLVSQHLLLKSRSDHPPAPARLNMNKLLLVCLLGPALVALSGAEVSSEEQSVAELSQLRDVRAADPGKGNGKGNGKGKDKGKGKSLKKKGKKDKKGRNLKKSERKGAGKKKGDKK